MPEKDKELKALRIEGRAKACEGILRSHLGKRPSAAGTRALQELRSAERMPGPVRWFATSSLPLRCGIAAAAVILIVVLIYAITGMTAPEAPGSGG